MPFAIFGAANFRVYKKDIAAYHSGGVRSRAEYHQRRRFFEEIRHTKHLLRCLFSPRFQATLFPTKTKSPVPCIKSSSCMLKGLPVFEIALESCYFTARNLLPTTLLLKYRLQKEKPWFFVLFRAASSPHPNADTFLVCLARARGTQ